MGQTVLIDPVTRIEGHLAIRTEIDNGQVTKAYCSGEMFRGFEVILKGRSPFDAHQFTQRICGVCPISHGLSSLFAQEMAYKVQPPTNGRLLRNLIQAANYIQSHILHFYHLSALDFVDIAAIAQYQGADRGLQHLRDWVKAQLASKALYPAAPFLPRYEGTYITNTELNIIAISHYVQALELRARAHQAAAIFAGKMPHAASLVPGGVTEKVTANSIVAYASIIKQLRDFIDQCYLPDVMEVAKAFPAYASIGKSYGNYMSFGVFPETDDRSRNFLPAGVVTNGTLSELDVSCITEDVGSSLFSSASGLAPGQGETVAAPDKPGAYSWLKAPRYKGLPMEVGPLARVIVAYMRGDPAVKTMVDATLAALKLSLPQLDSVLGRHAARALECKLVANHIDTWVNQLQPGQPTCVPASVPDTGSGHGLTEAPRGALGHWLNIKDGKIASYQCVVPTTWNCSPRDDKGTPGIVEKALEGTPVANPAQPVEPARVVRAFDPCIACAVH